MKETDLKKEAREQLRLSECCHATFEIDESVNYCDKCSKHCETIPDTTVTNYINKATLAERKRCAEIVRIWVVAHTKMPEYMKSAIDDLLKAIATAIDKDV